MWFLATSLEGKSPINDSETSETWPATDLIF